MNPIFPLLRKEAALFFRHRSGVILTFLVPVVLIYIFGWVFGLNGKKSGPTGIPLVVVSQTTEPAAQVLIDALRAEKTFRVVTQNTDAPGGPRPATEEDARQWLHENQQRFVLILPSDFISEQRLGLRLVFLNNPRNEIETTIVTGMLQKTIFTNLKDLLSKSLLSNARRHLGAEKFEAYNRGLASVISSSFGGDKEAIYQRFNSGNYWDTETFGASAATKADGSPVDPALRRLDATTPPAATQLQSTAIAPGTPTTPAATPASAAPPASTAKPASEDMLSRILKLENEQVVGKKVKNPDAARLVGGYAIMFLLFAVSGFATSFFGERSSGIFQRLLTTRARRHHLLWSKFLFCLLLGLGQISVLFLVGHLLYNLQLFDHLLPLLVVAIAASAACASFGMLIASITNNPQAANGLATMIVLTMSAVGGAWFPLSLMPEFMQKMAKFTVVYWSVEGFTNVLWADFGLVQSLPSIGVLLLMATLCQTIAIRRFQRGNMFT